MGGMGPAGRTDSANQGYLQPVALAFDCKASGMAGFGVGDVSSTMRAMGHSNSHQNGGGHLAVCVTGDITHTLKAEGFDASEDGTGRGQPIVAAFAENSRGELRYEGGDGERTGTLSTGGGKPGQGSPAIQVGMAVRRLTPLECERLQGFPDNHTLVPHRGKPAADGPRYKALGNSMAVPVMAWIGQRIQMVNDLQKLEKDAA
jgi:DNA (cytosine-5)-methyltransferase 1